MDNQISSDIMKGIKCLLKQVCEIEEGDEGFNRILKSVFTKIKKSDTMYFLNKKEVDLSIAGMAEKFNFHGFFPQAEALQKAYEKYVTKDLPKSVLTNQLNIVKLLLCLSERPTIKFLEKPEEFEIQVDKEVDEIDWKEYLNEGIDPWIPDDDGKSSEDDESDISNNLKDCTDPTEINTNVNHIRASIEIESMERNVIVDFRANREELLNTIQHSWYNQTMFQEFPPSKSKVANVEILWENFLEKEAMGLVKLPTVSLISEYKVIREILWQLWCPHASAVFELNINKIQVKNNITIASVRLYNFQNFIRNEFVPYIEVMEFFRQFSKSLETNTYECIDIIPITYKSYDNALNSIIRPVYSKLSELENMVHEQETTYTLLNLANDLSEILEPICQLRKIHEEVVVDQTTNSNLVCASTLLCSLHNSLSNAESKLDHDLKITLFLESLQHYMGLIDAWFTKNNFTDYTSEFPINKISNDYSTSEDTSFSDSDIWKLDYDLRDGLNEDCSGNGITKIITDTVLQIGRNLHLLRLLGNFSLLNETKETIHQQFVRRVLEELCQFFKLDPKNFTHPDETHYDEEINLQYKYPVVWAENSEKPVEVERLENLIDTTDGFLMLAFEDFLFEKTEKAEVTNTSLFEKISEICQTFFPILDFFENILKDILKERFTISGLIVKNMLIEQYHLEKLFHFLRHLFMFENDLIFPFYRRLFERMNSKNKNWGNDVWLTSALQDIIMDVYPEFYDKCTVHVNQNWRLCPDSVETCNMVSLQYTIQWPLNIIISSSQMAVYKDIFQFTLKIKWGLYTLTHLYFTDLEPKMKNYHKIKTKTHRSTISKLKYLKFVLVNLLSNIQHYIFSFIFTKCLQKFETDFEKAYDLSSIITAHSEFINNIRLMTMDIRSSQNNVAPFDTVLICVNKLKVMWNNIEYATPDRISNCQKSYEESYRAISPILFPVFIFTY